MFRRCGTLLRRVVLETSVPRTLPTALKIPKRNFVQDTMHISTPPRVSVSPGEQLLHCGFLFFVWISPILYFLTQLKVWRREYISG